MRRVTASPSYVTAAVLRCATPRSSAYLCGGSSRSRPVAVRRRSRARVNAIRQQDLGTISPQSFQRVIRPIFGMLDVHHDVGVIQQHPATLTFALTADRLGVEGAQPFLDSVDDGPHLPIVRCRTQDEGIGDGELVGYVVSDDVLGQLVRRGESSSGDELDGTVGSSH